MSRLGKLPIELKQGISAVVADGFITVKGPKGELKQELHNLINLEIGEKEILVKVNNPKEKKEKSVWGLYRRLVNNMVVGVSEGFSKKLEIIGVGFKAQASGQKITLNLGFSHPVIFELPAGIQGTVEANIITLSGADKQLVGETAARIRKIKQPEPYKGKGIKYADEVIRRKAGKAAAKGEK